MCISVEDDGCGFDPGQTAASGHYGLATMRERVQDVDGSLQIMSAPGAGTSIVVCLPMMGQPPGAPEGQIGPKLSLAGQADQGTASSPAHHTTPTN